MSAAQLGAELASLLGLDQDTVKTQIWPHLSGMTSPGAVGDYLNTLLGPDATHQSFIRSYISFRFPNHASASSQPPVTAPKLPWGGTTSTASSRNSSRASSSTRQQRQDPLPRNPGDQKSLESAFGGGGTVYVKNREEDWSMGGGGKKKGGATSAPRVSGSVKINLPPIEPTPSLSHAPSHLQKPAAAPLSPAAKRSVQAAPSTAPRTQPSKTSPAPDIVHMSPASALELLGIDRELQLFQDLEKNRQCFCAARQHPLSTYTPICRACGLVMCALNSPIHPCPSCAHSPLLSSQAQAKFIATLNSQRELVISREQARVRYLRQEEERERAAIRFPTLGGDRGGAPAEKRGYSNVAGAGPGLQERIEMAYKNGVSVGGQAFGTSSSSSLPPADLDSQAGPKVLSLDMKTKKVKVQTKVKGKGKEPQKTEEVALAEEVDKLDDGLVPWIDERDDGLTKGMKESKLELDVELDPHAPRRPFYNVTISEELQPVWEEDDGEETDVFEDAVESTATAPSWSPAVVPGASVIPEAKKKRKTRKGGDGQKKTKAGEVVV